jgi:hypothetical protein
VVETIVAVCKNSALSNVYIQSRGTVVLNSRSQRAFLSSIGDSVNSKALQPSKFQIVRFLSHPDPSIRSRELDVISVLIDEKHLEIFIPEILSDVKLADSEFRTELVSKIYVATQRFAPKPAFGSFDSPSFKS